MVSKRGVTAPMSLPLDSPWSSIARGTFLPLALQTIPSIMFQPWIDLLILTPMSISTSFWCRSAHVWAQ